MHFEIEQLINNTQRLTLAKEIRVYLVVQSCYKIPDNSTVVEKEQIMDYW